MYTRPWRTRKLLLKQVHHNHHPIATVCIHGPPYTYPSGTNCWLHHHKHNSLWPSYLINCNGYNDHPLHTSNPTISPCQPHWLSPLQLIACKQTDTIYGCSMTSVPLSIEGVILSKSEGYRVAPMVSRAWRCTIETVWLTKINFGTWMHSNMP